ncbi:MAG: hypothetical protein ACXWVJ_02385 [Caulobacteraceae bacterium]
MLAQTNRACTITDAAYLGGGKQKDESGKMVETKLYETACSDGPGLIIISREGQTPTANDCVQFATAAATTDPKTKPLVCKLSANATPYAGLQPILAKTGQQCQITKARWIGYSPSVLINQYEVGCADGAAFILTVPVTGATRPLAIDNCIRAGENSACQYLTAEQVVAAISKLAAPANRQCQITKARFVGVTPDRRAYYEVGCADEKAGYMFETDTQDRFVRAIDCAKASGLAGGCTYTNAAVAETEQSGIYTKLSGQIGHKCDVKEYRSIGMDSQKREVVEVLCANASDSGIVFLPTGAGQKGEYLNCIRASARSLRCGLVPVPTSYAVLTAQVSAKGKSCQVSNARGLGQDTSGFEYVEAACSGQPGVVIKYGPGSDSVQDVIACAQAKGIGGGCKLQ